MIISLIAALAENRVIGNKNRIPWHIKDDLLHFKQLTLNHTVVMGRTTFESLMSYYKKSGKKIPERRHIIVSRDPHYVVDLPACFVVHSIEDALKRAIKEETAFLATAAVAEANEGGGEIFISGGASIFKQTIGLANRLHLTVIHAHYEGDTYFPDYSEFTKVIGKTDKKTEGGLAYTFLDLER